MTTSNESATTEQPKKLGRPALTEEEKAERKAKRVAEKVNSGTVEVRDCIKIYFNPLMFAYLRDYHKQAGEQPGETIRQAVAEFFREKIASGLYTPSEDATPLAAKKAWEERVAKKKAEKAGGVEMSEDDDKVGEDK